MGGHSHGHGEPYQIPDYKTFKVEGIKQLEDLQVALAKKCLKDPWIRNEVWRYHPGFGTRASRARVLFTRGMPLGLGLAMVSTIIYKALPDGHGHGDHEHGDSGH
ncbi:NADH dehydrogenase [ubiquinone] 1 beta subcomplex subunit 3 [Hyposmocoma kahamanoa]|uniref:NADH dehydrogenase [ubiquinone] 1 beta subcomplex subunit 3 n=1 Tax=Hyposmocoma kahamanoa TaxID=1477025 RepID=UPI000E6D6254|nr:NADH dehydrogenase [ubiquinone] 1 beta subcomplex subunit 3 [Hyposmocoma kahamanoa]